MSHMFRWACLTWLLTHGVVSAADQGKVTFVALDGAPQPVLVESDVDLPTAQEFVAKLRASEPEQPLLNHAVVVWPMELGLQAAESYSAHPIRYFACRLQLANTTAAEVVIETKDIQLRAGGEQLTAGDLPERFPNYYVDLGRETIDVEQVRRQPAIAIAAGELREVDLLFAELPTFPVDLPLTLQVSIGKDTRRIDLRSLSQARLKLTAERLGPGGCVGWLNIDGTLDSVNCVIVADQVSEWAQAGVERFVVSWGPTAVEFDATLFEWFMDTVDEDNEVDPALAHLPRLQVAREMRLAEIPGGIDTFGYDPYVYGEERQFIFKQTSAAMTMAMKSVYEVADPQIVHQELLSGHSLSVIALLTAVPDQLTAADLDRVLQLSFQQRSLPMRYAAIEALGQFATSSASERIDAALQSEVLAERRAAAISVLRSPHASVRSSSAKILASPPLPLVDLIPLLVRYPQRGGTDFLLSKCEDTDAEVRRQALLGVSILGHPDLVSVMEQGLRDADENVRDLAFRIISQRTDRRSERSSLSYAIQLLEQGVFDDNVFQFLLRVRDPRVGTLLLAQLNDVDVDKQLEIITLLGSVGDDGTCTQLANRYETFDSEVKVAVLEALYEQRSPVARDLALARFDDPDLPVWSVALQILVDDGGPDVEACFLKRLLHWQSLEEEPDSDEVELLVDAISELNGPESRAALAAFRDYCYAKRYQQSLVNTLSALRMRMQLSPAWNAIETGMLFWRQDLFDEAIQQFELALQLDPDVSFANSTLGGIYLKQAKLDLALQQYQRAFELDPFDGQAITGIGIVRAQLGEPVEAVEFARQSIDKFPEDDIFAYNMGCVYGRAIEVMKTLPETPERTQLIAEYTRAAIADIDRSIDLGFDELELIQSDPDIHSLRDDPAFPALVERVRQNQ